MVSGTTPHVGGPVTGPGVPGVLINGQPVAVMGDMCVCAGPPDTIVQGCPGVLVNGVPVVVSGCMTAHGGTIPAGVPGVTVSAATPIKPVSIPRKQITFPKISIVQEMVAAVTGNAGKLGKAKKAINEVKTEAEKQVHLSDIFFSI
jgi:uncharacterized Zn-binding protein involved in type VI secretion